MFHTILSGLAGVGLLAIVLLLVMLLLYLGYRAGVAAMKDSLHASSELASRCLEMNQLISEAAHREFQIAGTTQSLTSAIQTLQGQLEVQLSTGRSVAKTTDKLLGAFVSSGLIRTAFLGKDETQIGETPAPEPPAKPTTARAVRRMPPPSATMRRDTEVPSGWVSDHEVEGMMRPETSRHDDGSGQPI